MIRAVLLLILLVSVLLLFKGLTLILLQLIFAEGFLVGGLLFRFNLLLLLLSVH
jgi:hypothetical protein